MTESSENVFFPVFATAAARLRRSPLPLPSRLRPRKLHQ
jgi:hypothetical protein